MPNPGGMPEESRGGKRVAICPSCRNPIRMSRTELAWSLIGCALLPALAANFLCPELVPDWAMVATVLVTFIICYKVSQTPPEKVHAV